jgi:hypothetical protein
MSVGYPRGAGGQAFWNLVRTLGWQIRRPLYNVQPFFGPLYNVHLRAESLRREMYNVHSPKKTLRRPLYNVHLPQKTLRRPLYNVHWLATTRRGPTDNVSQVSEGCWRANILEPPPRFGRGETSAGVWANEQRAEQWTMSQRPPMTCGRLMDIVWCRRHLFVRSAWNTIIFLFTACSPRGFPSRILHRRALPYAIDSGVSLLSVRKLKHTVNKVASLRDCHCDCLLPLSVHLSPFLRSPAISHIKQLVTLAH